MGRRNSKRLTIDDLLPSGSSENHIVKPNGKIVRAKKRKTVPVPYCKQYPTFFRLMKDNPTIPDPVEEFKFHSTRGWQIDVSWPELKLALEIEGGTFMEKGGHRGSISGYLKDKEKYNALCVHGWWLLRFTPQEMESCEAYDVLREWFRNNNTKKVD